MNNDDTGRYSAMYKPFHLIGLELNISILSAALLNKPTGSTQAFTADIISTAKVDLKAGKILDGDGGHTVWGKLYPAEKSIALGGHPIELAYGIKLKTDIATHSSMRWQDVEISNLGEVVQMRRAMKK